MKTKKGTLGIREVDVTEKGVTYTTFRIDGYDLKGNRIRFQSRDEQFARRKLAELQTQVYNADSANPLHIVQTWLTDTQIRESEAAHVLLGDRGGILDAVKVALDGGHFAAKLPVISLDTAIPAFLAEQKERVRPGTLQVWKSQLGRFYNYVGNVDLTSITTETIAKFIASLRDRSGINRAAPKTRNNIRADLYRFFAWCINTKGWLAGENPAAKISKARPDQDLKKVLPLAQCQELMSYAASFCGGMAAKYFALGLFAGIRPAEVGRLDETRSIAPDNNSIHLAASMAKTHKPRSVTIQPNLKQWLLQFPTGTMSEGDRSVRAIRKQFSLSHDILRHTFISNHVMQFGSFAETAIESGNSESIIRDHYFNRVSKADAQEFWRILPPAVM
jgi:integrase